MMKPDRKNFPPKPLEIDCISIKKNDVSHKSILVYSHKGVFDILGNIDILYMF